MPEKECPTSTVGPSCRASTRWAEATASGSVVSGFCTAVALSPAACNRAITSDQHEPSANSPCTSTTLLAFAGVEFAAMPPVEISEAAAPVRRAAEKARLFIIMISLPSRMDGNVWLHGVGGAERRRTPEISMSCRRSPPFCRTGASAPHGLKLEQCVDIGRTHDGPVAHEGLVVVFDAVMVVEIVDHDAEGFLDAAWRVVAEPIDTFEPRAVAEVKARYRVDAYRGSPRQIAGAKPQQGRAQLLALSQVMPPAVAFEFGQQRGVGIGSFRKPLHQPAPEARHWRQGGEALQLRKLRLQLFDHLLDQEIAERYAAEAVLAVGDRIKNRGVGARSLCPCGLFIRLECEQRRHGCGQAVHQRDFDEDQRLAGKCRMEECETAAVGRETPPQIIPALDLMHRLIGDQFFQHRCG